MKIYLHWYRHNEGAGNFGDELNPFIVKRLSGRKVQWKEPSEESTFMKLKIFVYNFFMSKLSLEENWNNLRAGKTIFGIGSIIRFCNPQIKVWGSGIIEANEIIPLAKFYAVRGKYTQIRMKELGHRKIPKAIGDPAILLPLVLPCDKQIKFKVGIIPHHIHYNKLIDIIKDDEIVVINLLDCIEKIVSQINSCELTLCTSLHGLIVSHAYKIDSLWIDIDNADLEKISGDNIKFLDYFSSVGLSEYTPISVDIHKSICWENFSRDLKHKFNNILVPNDDILLQRQKILLKVAPFKVVKKFRVLW